MKRYWGFDSYGFVRIECNTVEEIAQIAHTQFAHDEIRVLDCLNDMWICVFNVKNIKPEKVNWNKEGF